MLYRLTDYSQILFFSAWPSCHPVHNSETGRSAQTAESLKAWFSFPNLQCNLPGLQARWQHNMSVALEIN